jgi:hypothetical protein
MKKYKVYILVISVLIIIAIIWNTITEPGIKDLKSDFKEVVFIRNEQNSGPILRIYAVSLKAENWEEMEQYGQYMPHTKYGTTRIYFFLNNTDLPKELKFGEINIADRYKQNCIAVYEKNGMSQSSLRRYPYKN